MTALGEAFYEELLWVHGMLRQELELVRSLAARVADGLPADELRVEVAALKANGPLWALKVNCLHYCRFVHGHHRLEDVALFPALRAADPDIAPVVDRLEADHRVVAAQLEEIEAAVAGRRAGTGDRGARRARRPPARAPRVRGGEHRPDAAPDGPAPAVVLTGAPLIAFAPSTDLARSRAFYEGVLGLRLVEDSSFAVAFDAHGTQVRVTAVEQRVAAPYTVLGWFVPDIADAIDALAARGVAFNRYDGMDQDERGVWGRRPAHASPGSRIPTATCCH